MPTIFALCGSLRRYITPDALHWIITNLYPYLYFHEENSEERTYPNGIISVYSSSANKLYVSPSCYGNTETNA